MFSPVIELYGQGNSALHYAMSNGQFEMVKLLLDTRKCDISRQNKTGCTVVMLASLVQLQTDSDRDVIRRLFQLGDINQQASLVRRRITSVIMITPPSSEPGDCLEVRRENTYNCYVCCIVYDSFTQ